MPNLVVWTANDTEVEFLVFFCLVGIVKVVEKAVYQVFLLRFALACRRVCSEVGCRCVDGIGRGKWVLHGKSVADLHRSAVRSGLYAGCWGSQAARND